MASKKGTGNISRNTFALFMEPDFGEPMVVPTGRSVEHAVYPDPTHSLPSLESRWQQGIDFERFELNTYGSFNIN